MQFPERARNTPCVGSFSRIPPALSNARRYLSGRTENWDRDIPTGTKKYLHNTIIFEHPLRYLEKRQVPPCVAPIQNIQQLLQSDSTRTVVRDLEGLFSIILLLDKTTILCLRI